ncbi:MAG: hypothetical protein U9N77_15715 [Thermodesulfobacteriota bacterium]|nr:hypothetical protein [Thermodesulfobacteriota bacterium]
MYIIASILFFIGIAAGGLYGFIYEQTVLEIIFSSAIGGFVGSAAGGVIFSYLYFISLREEEEETTLPVTPLLPEKMEKKVQTISFKKSVKKKPILTKVVKEKPVQAKVVKAKAVKVKAVKAKTVKAKAVKAKAVKAKAVKEKPVQAKVVKEKPIEKKVTVSSPICKDLQETDKQKIKRLRKEIKKIKKRSEN